MRPFLILPLLLAPAMPALAQDATPTLDAVGIHSNPAEFNDIPIDDLRTERLVDTPLIGAAGDQIGIIENVLLIEDDTDKLVIGTGGYGDLSTRKVLLDLADVRVEETEDGTLQATTALTEEEIDALAAYESA